MLRSIFSWLRAAAGVDQPIIHHLFKENDYVTDGSLYGRVVGHSKTGEAVVHWTIGAITTIAESRIKPIDTRQYLVSDREHNKFGWNTKRSNKRS